METLSHEASPEDRSAPTSVTLNDFAKVLELDLMRHQVDSQNSIQATFESQGAVNRHQHDETGTLGQLERHLARVMNVFEDPQTPERTATQGWKVTLDLTGDTKLEYFIPRS